MDKKESKGRKTKSKTIRVGKKAKAALDPDVAAKRIQCVIRRFVARRRVKRLANEVWQRVFDPAYKQYFWFDTLHKKSSWVQPRHTILFSPQELAKVVSLQKVVRGFVHRARTKHLASEVYTRYYDMENSRFYWLDHRTNRTTHRASPWLLRQNVKMPPEDQLLLQSQLRIRELERKLLEKDIEITKIRKARYEELEPQVLRDKVKRAENLVRSKHMEDWSVDDMAAWFTELKMDEYIPALYTNRVDGRLFINLGEEEYRDLGIANKFHLRKLELILRAFKARFQRRKDRAAGKVDEEDDDELLSEYSPSELSAILADQDRAVESGEDSEEDSDGDQSSHSSDEDEDEVVTEEQKLQAVMDSENISTEVVMRGDGVNFPMVGDIVRVRYTVSLANSSTLLMSTKNSLDRSWVEFVLGIGQVITGFDRALPKMSVGERSKHSFSPQYAYGKEGLFPHIPPNAVLVFDVTLLEFRPRCTWIRPLIQDLLTTNEKPFIKDLKLSLEKAHALGEGHRIAQVLSASLLLNEGVDYNALNNSNNMDAGSVRSMQSF